MKNTQPFDIGKIASGLNFINRKDDIIRLKQNFTGRTNTVLISPRRWGKSSLVEYTAKKIMSEEKNYRVCFLDLFRTHTENEFYELYSKALIKATSNKYQEWIQNGWHFLSGMAPSLSLLSLPDTQMELEVKLPLQKISWQQVFDLPEKIATEKKIKLVVCIDEFQNIEKFSNPLLFQQRLRSFWQHHKNVTYCVYGSKRHLMAEMFGKRSMPFYKFGDVFFLKKIESHHWTNFIIKKFDETKKSISESHAEYISTLMQNHSYYVQVLAQIVWYNTVKKTDDDIMKNSVDMLIERNAMMFQKDYDTLSETQVNYLIALASGEKNMHAKDVLEKYNLGTSGNVPKIISALENKEIIDRFEGAPEFSDPVFELWFRKMYHLVPKYYHYPSTEYIAMVNESKAVYQTKKKKTK